MKAISDIFWGLNWLPGMSQATLPKIQPKPALVCSANQLNSRGNNHTGSDCGDAPRVAGGARRSGVNLTLLVVERLVETRPAVCDVLVRDFYEQCSNFHLNSHERYKSNRK
ncbi:unnamed protein product [Ixodes persulcatus]